LKHGKKKLKKIKINKKFSTIFCCVNYDISEKLELGGVGDMWGK